MLPKQELAKGLQFVWLDTKGSNLFHMLSLESLKAEFPKYRLVFFEKAEEL